MDVVIVGNGIAGVTAARHVRKADPDATITIISGEAKEPYARTALMYVYMGVLTREHTWMYEERFWHENRIERVVDHARGLDVEAQTLDLEGGPIPYDRLLVATGSRPNIPPWPGADLPGVQGLYHWADLDRLEAATPGAKHAVVVGGGLIGVELAEMLTVRGVDVTFLVRDDRYLPNVFSPQESALVADAIRAHHVDLRFGVEVASIEGDGHAESVVTTNGDRLPADVVGVGTGVVANTEWLGGALEVRRGVLVDAELRASAPNVWAAGDCAELR
ncbi:NAD(P)/FAD-dependent oxidoreductase, partial [Rubrivirga sp.]|uniref:NAD(P)/FAD-dependent oxidoreductase n=1 Tax=Rubrivirga sp. TaxID=1885344 RepID=UPI003C755251